MGKIKFDLSEVYTLEDISNLQLELLENKKEILEELKYSDQTLSGRIFKEMTQNICQIFDDIFVPLNIKKKLLLRQAVYAERAAADKKTSGPEATFGFFTKYKIADRFEIKTLKFKNKLLYTKAAADWKKNRAELKKNDGAPSAAAVSAKEKSGRVKKGGAAAPTKDKRIKMPGFSP